MPGSGAPGAFLNPSAGVGSPTSLVNNGTVPQVPLLPIPGRYVYQIINGPNDPTLAVASLSQTNPAWSSTVYDDLPLTQANNTIGAQGSELVCLTMALNYASAQARGHTTDPASLNNFMEQNAGSDFVLSTAPSGWVSAGINCIATTAGAAGTLVAPNLAFENDVLFNNTAYVYHLLLASNCPVIVGVNLIKDPVTSELEPTHFVLVYLSSERLVFH